MIVVLGAKIAILRAFRMASALHGAGTNLEIPVKTNDKTNASGTSIETPVIIDTAALDDVTGGCGCGRDCERGAAPAAVNRSQLPAAFSPFGR